MEGTLYWSRGLLKGTKKCEALIEEHCNELLFFDGPLFESPPILVLQLKSLDDEPPIRRSQFQTNGVVKSAAAVVTSESQDINKAVGNFLGNGVLPGDMLTTSE